jgi:hypothetical protein
MRSWRWGVPLLALSCGDGFVPSPFVSARETPPDAGSRGPGGAGADAGVPDSPSTTPSEVLGGPCVDDAQCDDGIDCTFGLCDASIGRCRLAADDERCSDAVFCNGAERCDPRIGCRPGAPTSCSDSTPCTIDRCDEATRSCVRVDRDVDGDGVVDGNCRPNGDCNDLDPRISSDAPELCGNQRDDDCDGQADEAGCELPRHDTCADALPITAAGSYVLSSAGAVLDYGVSCAAQSPGQRELVLSIDVPAGEPRDIEIVARALFGNLALSRVASCGAASEEAACVRGALTANGEIVARSHFYSPAPGSQILYLYTDGNGPVQVDVSDQPPSTDAGNTSCAARAPLEPGVPLDVDLAVPGPALESACGTPLGDRVFEFSLDEAADVQLVAQSLDGFGVPRLSLREGGCDALADELRCNQRQVASTRVRALPAGTYVVALSASGPTRARLSLDVQPPTVAPPEDTCASPPALTPNQTQPLGFGGLDDDIAAGCSPGSLDDARRLALDQPSDVLLVARFSAGDVGSVSLAPAECPASEVAECSRTADELARVSRRGLPAGEYRVVTESLIGLPATVLAAVRPAAAPILVPGAESCSDALAIDPGGGSYQGNTSNAEPDFTAGCDFATPNGAPDQLLSLTLSEPRRVLFDMRGSDFETLLDVRRGPACPGDEVAGGCAVFSGGDRSFLDLRLSAGQYFVQVDGYAGGTGNWFLNVYVLDP